MKDNKGASIKRVKEFRGWKIYKETVDDGMSVFWTDYCAYLPGQSPATMDYPEFTCGSINECIENIRTYGRVEA